MIGIELFHLQPYILHRFIFTVVPITYFERRISSGKISYISCFLHTGSQAREYGMSADPDPQSPFWQSDYIFLNYMNV